MRVLSASWEPVAGWTPPLAEVADFDSESTLVLAFGDSGIDPTLLTELAEALPSSLVTGCSTAGQILGAQLAVQPLVVTAIKFELSQPRMVSVEMADEESSAQVGAQLGKALVASESIPDGTDQTASDVLILSVGLDVNGSDLVTGLAQELPPGTRISGGLAGDDADFERTWVLWQGEQRERCVVAIDLGTGVSVSHGSEGGWEGFGPRRTVTRSDGNVLFELDHRPALALYKEYLGDLAEGLPASALRFPLAIESPDGGTSYVRTVLAVDEDDESMTYAGAVPTGWTARLMRTTTDRLVEGAHTAAKSSAQPSDSLTIAISCVGRRLTLGERTEDEIEAVVDALGSRGGLIGFYSYGEISPIEGVSGLHNQTMTVTTISEPGV